MGDVVLMPLRQPPAERIAEVFAAADAAWPGYLARLEAEEREIATQVAICPPRLRVVR